MPEVREADVSKTGWNQADVVAVLTNIQDVLNEIQSDHAVVKTFIDECKVDIDALFADVTAIHAAILGITAQLDLDATVTDTTYASGNDPAAITATTIGATAVATLTNSTAISLLKG